MHPISATRPSLLLRLRDPADDVAWREFDRRYGPLILAYCRMRGWQQSDAEDIRQLVMRKLARRLRTFEYRPEPGGFRRYLRTVTHGEIIRHAAQRGAPQPSIDAETPDPSTAPREDESLWDREWMRHHFRIAWGVVKKNTDETSLEVFQQLLEGASFGEIARGAGMSEPAVRKVKQRICERLRNAIAEQILDEEHSPRIAR